jgi:glycosyltransferase involved in cell wall biosynthesis
VHDSLTMGPLVTVVTPSLNQGRFIRATIDSVLTQDYPAVEYLVMDGGSTDDTLAILQSYSSHLTWDSRSDTGQASAVNAGWRQGRGEILGWLNSDDLYLPGAVTTAVAYLERHPHVDAVYGDGYHLDEAGAVLERYPTEPFDLDRLAEVCFICQPSVFLRRQAVEKVGGLDEALRYCMDYDLWIRLGGIARFGLVPRYLAATRMHSATKTLGERTAVYAEIVDMVARHYGSVPLTWVYAYAKAQAWNGRPGRARAGVRFGLIAFRTFVRHNWRHPLAGLGGWRLLASRVLGRWPRNPW